MKDTIHFPILPTVFGHYVKIGKNIFVENNFLFSYFIKNAFKLR